MPGTALILGTLPGQSEAIEWLHGHGWTAYACGHRAEGPGVETADGFFLTDILDVEGVSGLAADLAVDVVYSVGSDIAMPTIARVNERLGLPGYHDVQTTDLLQRKVELRPFLNRHGLGEVVFATLTSPSDLEAFDRYPAVLKPSDSQGQRGIAVVASPDEACQALPGALAASASGTAVIEEWLDGAEISIHVFVVDGRVRLFLPSDRHTWEGTILGVAQAHSLPSVWLEDGERPAVERLVQDFVTALRVDHGPLYFQVKLTSRGPRIIEVASRLDGCHLWRLVREHTGVDLLAAVFGGLAGEPWHDPEPWDDRPGHTLELMLADPKVPFRPTDHLPPSDRKVTFEYHYLHEGQLPRSTNGVIERVGYRVIEELT